MGADGFACDQNLQGKVGQQGPEVPEGVADQVAPLEGQRGLEGLNYGGQHVAGGCASGPHLFPVSPVGLASSRLLCKLSVVLSALSRCSFSDASAGTLGRPWERRAQERSSLR